MYYIQKVPKRKLPFARYNHHAVTQEHSKKVEIHKRRVFFHRKEAIRDVA